MYVPNGRDDGQDAVLVGNASIVFHSIHVSIGHLDVLGPLFAGKPPIRASLVTTADQFDVMFGPWAAFGTRARRARIVKT